MGSNEEPLQGTRMCKGCFKLFEKASSLIITAHNNELAKAQEVQYELIGIIKDFRAALSPKILGVAEVALFFGCIDGVLDTTMDQKPVKETNSKEELPSNRAKPQQPIPKAPLPPVSEEKENSLKTVVDYRSNQPVKTKNAVFSREASIEDKPSKLSTHHRSMSGNSATLYLTGSALSDKKTTQESGELDKRIRELEKEKVLVESKKQSSSPPPTVFALPRLNIENPKAMMSVDTAEIDLSILEDHRLVQTQGGRSTDDVSSRTTITGNAQAKRVVDPFGKNSRKKEMMSLVYKVNTKQIDFDKFDRKRSSKPNTKESQESLDRSSRTLTSKVNSHTCSFVNDDICATLKADIDPSELESHSGALKPLIKPLQNLDKLKKSGDKGIDTPHF